MNNVEKDFKSKGTVSKRITVPMLVWEEWESDCKENFNNTYSLKMQFDHQFRNEIGRMTELIIQDLIELKAEVFELKAELASFNDAPVEDSKPQGRKTFGARK